ncbi:MAG TPA: L,D-transpeptidase [Myxococcales bacterium]|nr:L,D-transpeptidase [Myxococcales bacterium]
MRSLALLLLLAACGGIEHAPATTDEADLDGVGSVEGSGQWGAATTCKALPTGLPKLNKPAIVVSLDGLTLHLWDQAGTFDKVYPIGPGAIQNGVSLTPVGHFTTGPADTTAGASDNPNVIGGSPWAWWYRCKMWWTDPDTKQITPVYGGLPLIRLDGPPTLGYAIHGPIDNFGAPNGGSLRRAYVSHGCVRMRAEDIAEVFVLLHGHGSVPVTIQRAVERDAEGRAVDLPQRWVGSECSADADCNFPGGSCRPNAYGRNFCTMACSGTCPDRAGEIATACVPDGAGHGMCVRQASALDNFCRPYESFEYKASTTRFGSSKPVDACVPGSAGFVGDPCLSSTDCTAGRTCERHGSGPGLCTQPCTSSCPTQNGIASACVLSRCLRACDVQDACGGAVAATCERGGTSLACVPSSG